MTFTVHVDSLNPAHGKPVVEEGRTKTVYRYMHTYIIEAETEDEAAQRAVASALRSRRNDRYGRSR